MTAPPRRFGVVARGDEPHDDAALKGDQIAADIESEAVLVRPRRPDRGPDGGLALADDTIEPIGWRACRKTLTDRRPNESPPTRSWVVSSHRAQRVLMAWSWLQAAFWLIWVITASS